MFSFYTFLLFSSLAFLVVNAQDGVIRGKTTDPTRFRYYCDGKACKLPNCNCASTNPPGGLSPSDTPMFLVFTADDAVQGYTINAVKNLLDGRKNPNGCPVKMTYYTSTSYTNFSYVTDWYVQGNEIADHTMTHVGDPKVDEINGNLIALNQFAGIPLKSIQGFRTPYLNWTKQTLQLLAKSGFMYDSSATSSIPVTDPNTDAYWPYTLDNGLANNCLSVSGICNGEPKIPGFWEIPMYAIFDDKGVEGPHLMDPWLDVPDGQTNVNDNATLQYMKNTFTTHYQNKRQPFGIYTHPIHLAVDLQDEAAPNSTINMIKEFLNWAQEQQDVWIVSSAQLLAWVRNPRPISQLDQVDAFKCSTPQVSQKICNGMPQNEVGLLSHCAFSDFPWSTCYGCPTDQPSPSNPSPPQASVTGQQQRFRLPSNCATAFFDPIKNKCLCKDNSCQFTDNSRLIGPNGENLTSGASGPNIVAPSGASLVPFNGSPSLSLRRESGTWAAMVVGVVSVLSGMTLLKYT